MPMAWDRTSLSEPVPNPHAAHLPDTTRAGATAVYDFLNRESTKVSTWGSSPLWGIVDGPWKVADTTSNGGVTFVANRDYSGPVKPTLDKFVEVPFTSEAAMVDQLKSQGTNALTVAYVPSQYQPLTAQLKREGYDLNMASGYGIAYFPLNLHAPKVGAIFRQLYFRQALQHLVDQQGWIQHFLNGTAVPTDGPIPLAPPSKLVSASVETDLYPFSVSDADQLLKAHGWHVVPGGETICVRPGSGPGECGRGIAKGQGISFNIDYESGVQSVEEEMEDLQSQASKAGIKIALTTHPVNDVYAAAAHCASGQPSCGWESENWGSGWGYAFYPSGDELFFSNAISNASNYANHEMDRLIDATITATPSQEHAAMTRYVKYAEQQLPVVWIPTSVSDYGTPGAGTLVDTKLGGYAANVGSGLTPELWYLTK